MRTPTGAAQAVALLLAILEAAREEDNPAHQQGDNENPDHSFHDREPSR